MNKSSKLIFFIAIGSLLLGSCKTEFERLRASNDTQKMYDKAFEYYENEDYNKAQLLLEQVLSGLRGKVEAEKVYFYFANAHFYQQQYILASYYYKNFAQTFPNSEYREEADYMSAYSNFKLSPSFRLDQKHTTDAIEGLQVFINTYPNSDRIKECNALIDEMRFKLETKAFDEGKLYYDLSQYQAARRSFENLLTQFPETKRAEEVRYLKIKAAFQLAENSVPSKQEERYKLAMNDYRSFSEKYKKSKYRKELKAINSTSNKKLKEIIRLSNE